uniref:F-box domain-containing protein n=1 Tax=Helicotheca tamesis TaxID=374047 RepID=A0A7S2HK52_9STRA|mmetsp:Transcript_18733/g.25814  ORF Transcript_18733/g.25814 Transcript_18733/m.25814 type:complete len:148 (+) Transcript_18733:141-584(+)|eukprot:CAMPEP_0185738778 /NCGR_PEP_ID=MMETSP1171-20130828/33829_1 /TAXON_ID=374046 /ORGANISM="Helicotheca tamensis, Strain CCMP826" /LENGTH=147 /DNA_ID=CAMNT_0028410125 /DNA_START=82 /DNA_END=525 /DNA_ORIENTATION=+
MKDLSIILHPIFAKPDVDQFDKAIHNNFRSQSDQENSRRDSLQPPNLPMEIHLLIMDYCGPPDLNVWGMTSKFHRTLSDSHHLAWTRALVQDFNVHPSAFRKSPSPKELYRMHVLSRGVILEGTPLASAQQLHGISLSGDFSVPWNV